MFLRATRDFFGFKTKNDVGRLNPYLSVINFFSTIGINSQTYDVLVYVVKN